MVPSRPLFVIPSERSERGNPDCRATSHIYGSPQRPAPRDDDARNRGRWVRLAVALFALLLATTESLAAPHPLDSLSASEIRSATAAIRRAFPATARIHSLDLQEPDKAAVLAWRTGQPMTGPLARRAFAVVRDAQRTFEATIDLATGAVQRTEVPEIGRAHV